MSLLKLKLQLSFRQDGAHRTWAKKMWLSWRRQAIDVDRVDIYRRVAVAKHLALEQGLALQFAGSVTVPAAKAAALGIVQSTNDVADNAVLHRDARQDLVRRCDAIEPAFVDKSSQAIAAA